MTPTSVSIDTTDADNVTNSTISSYPEVPTFSDHHLMKVVITSFLFLWAAVGNVSVLAVMQRSRSRSRTPLHSLVFQLTVADSLVTFITMPSEAAWAATVSWKAGEVMCRVIKFLQVIGLYQSTFITVAISLDRAVAVLFPFSKSGAPHRTKVMIIICWVLSTVFSFPQAIIFHIERLVPGFEQCVDFNFYGAKWQKQLYNTASFVLIYPLPLVIIITAYVCIILRITKNTRTKGNAFSGSQHVRSEMDARREQVFTRAKIRTLWMTVGIVTAFVVCWTPFYVHLFWVNYFDTSHVSRMLTDLLYLFGMSNACVNPMVYGLSTFLRAPPNSNKTRSQTLHVLYTLKNHTDNSCVSRSPSRRINNVDKTVLVHSTVSQESATNGEHMHSKYRETSC
ncbi:gonadotropin-releasing hormone receptor-like [Branchiostoma floridae]|uniref:Gonadotropin-releasing hormone receptor-like n=1 Tax=Branchiostoma floridae TaxID=7739 RepID=A0A9J7HT38_BRAFL|nr:gonadotropin-releasing hormone receptor-like [Branchiostoma floridae]